MGNQGNWGGPPQGGGPGAPGGMGPQGGWGAPPGAPAPGGYGGAPAGAPGGYGAPPGGYGAPPGGYGAPAAMGMGGYGQPASPYGQYEFTQAENAVVDDCAKWGTALAIIYFVVGGFSIFSLCSSPLQATINIVTYILVGVFIMMAAKSLRLVVNTQGHDVAHMMEALDKLGSMFLVRIIAATVSLVLTIIVLLIQVAQIVANL